MIWRYSIAQLSLFGKRNRKHDAYSLARTYQLKENVSVIKVDLIRPLLICFHIQVALAHYGACSCACFSSAWIVYAFYSTS